MSRGKGSFIVKTLAAVAFFAASGFSQTGNTARIPVVVNVNATVSIIPPAGAAGAAGVTNRAMSAGVQEVLEITLEGGSAVLYRSQRSPNAPASVSYGKGRILLELHPQTFGDAQVSLFSASGRRVLRGNVSAAKSGGLDISRSNVAKGVYLLSVKGAGGGAFTVRVPHSGGRLGISVAFGEGAGSLGKGAVSAAEGWTITASAAGYNSASLPLSPVAGNNPLLEITLTPEASVTYKTVKIGGQTWMAENLNIKTDSSWCYNDADSNCVKYGRLYTWGAAMTACPRGWHLPTRQEWDTLMTAVGGSSTAGTKLKSKEPDWNGTDDYRFSALPGGGRNADGSFDGLGSWGYWWSATEFDASNAYGRGTDTGFALVGEGSGGKDLGFSVRCVQN